MKKLLFFIVSLMSLCSTFAQDVLACPDNEFREIVRGIISKGNQQYDRSYRTGIKQYADSLAMILEQRSNVGKLAIGDSLEFTADLLKLRADWHYENGNYDSKSYSESERLFSEALSIYESNSNMPNNLNGLPILQREMAQLMYKLGRYDEALTYTEAAYKRYVEAYDKGEFDDYDKDYATMLDIKSQKAMCLAHTAKTLEALKLMDELLDVYPKASEGYFEILRKKGKILMLSQKPGREQDALCYYKQYFTWRKADALKTLGTMTSVEREDYWMRIRPFVADCYQLEDIDPAFLYDVTLFAKGLLLQLNRMSGRGVTSELALASLQHTWTDIQSTLTEDACAIEFVQYEKFGIQYLGAIVLKNTGAPTWVQMMAPDKFYDYRIGGGGIDNRTRLCATGIDTKDKRNRLYSDETFCNEIWTQALVCTIGNAQKIYFSPDGYLQQFALEYMDYCPFRSADIFRLSSTRRLLENTAIRCDAALIVGNVDYYACNPTAKLGNDTLAYDYVVKSHISFGTLADSNIECQLMMEARDCPSDTLLSGVTATEQNFMDLCNRYPMIVLSTHGLFDDAHVVEGTDIKTNRSDESLSHSLIALSGINRNTENENFEKNLRDGILSARELSNINMDDVDVAVISACQTGLGYITADGVFGLQRGLKNAGVDVIVVSLWEVSNSATQLLMLSFLKYLHDGFTLHTAFEKARNIMCDTDKSKAERKRLFGKNCKIDGLLDSYEEPYYQNAFIMIDAIE